MKIPQLLLLTLSVFFLYFTSMGQSVPFPTNPDPTKIEPWGYDQVGTNWDTSPFLPFIYNYDAFRLMPPNDVSYDTDTDTWSYDPNVKYPILLFFHGNNVAGNDNNQPLKNGADKHMEAVLSDRFPAFLLHPQNIDEFSMKIILDKLLEELPIDKTRIYAYGISGGAKRTWQFSLEYPEVAAAIFPMSGAVAIDDYSEMIYTPVRQAQGGRDVNPTPSFGLSEAEQFVEQGGNHELFYSEDLGHGTWNRAYAMDDYYEWYLTQKINKIYAKYDYYEVCPEEEILVTLGVNPYHGDYEWKRNDVIIEGANDHEYIATEFGDYSVRISLGTSGEWTEWSEVKTVATRQPTQTPVISTSTLRSYVLPDPNGSTTIELSLPEGYETYQWYQDEELLGEGSTLTTGKGVYVAYTLEKFGCSSLPSEPFVVYENTYSDIPEKPISVFVSVESKTEIDIAWSDNSNNETNFELYRRLSLGDDYEMIALLDTGVSVYSDSELLPGTTYFYSIRAINENGASPLSIEMEGTTKTDLIFPTAPANLSAYRPSDYSVYLEWNESTDDVGIKNYLIYQDGVKVLSTTDTEITVYNLANDQVYTFNVVAVDLSGNHSVLSNRVVMSSTSEGLNYKYYETGWLTALPDFDTLTPVKTGHSSGIDISVADQDNYYALYWEGTISIPVAGSYTFETRSDDGSKMYIGNYDEADLVVDNDGAHGNRYRTGTYVFPSAGSYSIVMTYFERVGTSDNMELYWKNTAHGIGNSRELVPESQYSTEQDLLIETLQAPSAVEISTVSHEEMEISWTDNSDNEIGFQVFRSTDSEFNFVSVGVFPADSSSMIDSSLEPETTYYYRVLVLGEYIELAAEGEFIGTTSPLPPLPEAPIGFTASALDVSTVEMNWEQGDEDIYEIVRSTSQNDTFISVATIVSPTTSFVDSYLLPHKEYFYAIRTQNARGYSEFSDTISVITLNSIPEISASSNYFKLDYEEVKNFMVTGIDGDSDDLTFEGVDWPDFITITSQDQTSATLTIDPSFENVGNYISLGIKAKDAFGGSSEILYFDIDIYVNEGPVITFLESHLYESIDGEVEVELYANESIVLNYSFYDNEGDLFTVDVISLPDFASYEEISSDQGVLLLEPEMADIGFDTILIQAEDVNNRVNTLTLVLNVTEVGPEQNPVIDYETVLVNFTNTSNSAMSSPWNNLVGTPVAGLEASELENTEGLPTAYGIVLLNEWSVSSGNGSSTGNDTGVYPDTVISTYFADDSDTDREIELSGLDTSKLYDIIFFSSRNDTNQLPDRYTGYSVSGTTVELLANNNTSKTVEINAIECDENGKIFININASSSNAWCYINAIEIRSYEVSILPLSPTGLSASAQSHESIKLNWNINSTNENGFEIYRSLAADGPWLLINTAEAGTEEFTDTDLTENSIYFYRIRAFNDEGKSTFSTQASESTLSLIDYQTIFVNFTTKSDLLAPSPWNNLQGNPSEGLGINNLKSALGVGTSVSIDLLNSWSTGNSTGAITGDDSGAFLDIVMSTYFADASGAARQIELNGLDASKLYDLTFFGSRGSVSDTRITNYTVGLQSSELLTTNNTSETATIKGIKPDVGNNILIEITSVTGSWEYINAIEIKYYDEPSTPFAVSDLFAEAQSHESIKVSWTDNSSNEDSFEIYRSLQAEGSWTLIASLGVNEVEFVDSGLDESTQYYYKVRAINTEGASEFTVETNDYTFEYADYETVLINFTSKSSLLAEAPWNNLLGTPSVGLSLHNLENDAGIETTMDIELLTSWSTGSSNGEMTGDESGIYPDVVMNTYFADTGVDHMIDLSGLDNTKLYDLFFFGSRGSITDSRITEYSIGSKSEELLTTANTSERAIVIGVQPDANNKITVNVNVVSGSWKYINALEVRSYDEPLIPFSPSNLSASAQSDQLIQVTWEDNSTNEEGFEIYRSLEINGPWNLVSITNENENIFIDSGLSESTAYFYQVRAVNGFGTSDYTAIVEETTFPYSSYQTVLLNFTSNSSNSAEQPWNNLVGTPSTGLALNDLHTTLGIETTIEVSLLNSWASGNSNGTITGDDSGVYPDVVMDSYFADTGLDREIELSGLDGSKFYDLLFFGSRGDITDSRISEYSVNDESTELLTSNNTTETTRLKGIAPDENNKISIKVNAITGTWAYINAVQIRFYDEPLVPFEPSLLTAKAQNGESILLNWEDNSTNEEGFEIYRSLDVNGPWTLISATGTDQTKYLDEGLIENTLYFYKVEAFNDEGASNYVTTQEATYDYIVYINIGNADFIADSPWNNTGEEPFEGNVITNLKNNDDQGTGVNMEIATNDFFTTFADSGYKGTITGDNSGIYPDVVMESYYWIEQLEVASIKFSGLPLNQQFDFECFASRAATSRGTTFSIGETSIDLLADNNISNTVTIENVTPDENGEMMLDMVSMEGTILAYVNAIVIKAAQSFEINGTVSSRALNSEIKSNESELLIEQKTSNIIAYPNPFDHTLSLRIDGIEDSFVQYDIFDQTGRLVLHGISTVHDSRENIEINTKSLLIGLYFMKIQSESGFNGTLKIIKQ